ncbi:MAG: integrase core domain-containing protein [bacterium]
MRIFNKFKGTKGFIATWERVIRFQYMITEQAKERVRILAFWEKHGDQATKEAFKASRATLFRWQKALYDNHGRLEALNPKSTAPAHRRKRQIPEAIEAFILREREHSPRLSKDKLAAMMKADGIALLSASTVGRMLTDLKSQGKLPKHTKLTLSARTGRLIERTFKPRKKLRRPKGHRVLEADTIVRFVDGIRRYILTAVDTEGRLAFAGAYTNHGSASAADFLAKTREVLPDCPTDVQTDNGSEFALHFHQAVGKVGLHFNTHPRSPKENAHVERFNRTLDEEFLRYHRGLLRDDVAEFNKKLVDWLIWYNTRRPHWALGLLSPLQYICSHLTALESQKCWTDT